MFNDFVHTMYPKQTDTYPVEGLLALKKKKTIPRLPIARFHSSPPQIAVKHLCNFPGLMMACKTPINIEKILTLQEPQYIERTILFDAQ